MVFKSDNDFQMMKTTRSPHTVKTVKSVHAVLEALQQVNHATAQEITDWLSVSKRDNEISLTSVYRALNHLVGKAEVKPLNFNDGQVRYELNTQKMHHHHFVCTQCNHVQVVDVCPFEQILDTLRSTFLIQYHNFEVIGLCESCQN